MGLFVPEHPSPLRGRLFFKPFVNGRRHPPSLSNRPSHKALSAPRITRGKDPWCAGLEPEVWRFPRESRDKPDRCTGPRAQGVQTLWPRAPNRNQRSFASLLACKSSAVSLVDMVHGDAGMLTMGQRASAMDNPKAVHPLHGASLEELGTSAMGCPRRDSGGVVLQWWPE